MLHSSLLFCSLSKFIFRAATTDRRDVSKMRGIPWLKVLLWPLEPSEWLACWPLTSPASCVLHLYLLQPWWTPHGSCVCVWFSLSSLSCLGIPGWWHPLSLSPFWLILVGCFWKSMFSQVHSGSALALHLSPHCAPFCVSVSPSTRPFTPCLLIVSVPPNSVPGIQ